MGSPDQPSSMALPVEPLASPEPSQEPGGVSPQEIARHTKPKRKQQQRRPSYLAAFPTAPWPPPFMVQDGLRRVEPYHFTYNTWVKERWRGMRLLDIFEGEFRDRPLEYYKHCMETGGVLINGKPASPDYVVKNGDLVSHICHRHEPPVTAEPIQVLHEDDELIVINKPSGIPVHPAGRYNLNSVVEIMRSQRSPDFKAYPCNRLDRLTSGVMFIAKSPQAAERMRAQIMGRTVRKEYLARVVGRFPDGEVVCNEPILQISPKLGLNRVRANGKASRTVFKRLAYYPSPGLPADEANDEARLEFAGQEQQQQQERQDGKSEDKQRDGGQREEPSQVEAADPGRPWTAYKGRGYSIVRCLPVTGRTHQLRVHLQFLGHPIENDPIYANYRVWGFNLGAADADASLNSDEDVISRLSRMGKDQVADAVAYYDEMVDQYYKKKAEKMSGELCQECDTPLYTDPGEHELSLWLHSLRYEDASEGAWSYTSPLPKWALPPDGMSGPTSVGGMEDLVGAVRETNPELASEMGLSSSGLSDPGLA